MPPLAEEILRAQPLLTRIELVLEAARRRGAPILAIALSPGDFRIFEAEAETSLRIGGSGHARDYGGVRVRRSGADSYVETATGPLALFSSDERATVPASWAAAASFAAPGGS